MSVSVWKNSDQFLTTQTTRCRIPTQVIYITHTSNITELHCLFTELHRAHLCLLFIRQSLAWLCLSESVYLSDYIRDNNASVLLSVKYRRQSRVCICCCYYQLILPMLSCGEIINNVTLWRYKAKSLR